MLVRADADCHQNGPVVKKNNSLLANPMAKEFVVLNASGFESRLEDGYRDWSPKFETGLNIIIDIVR